MDVLRVLPRGPVPQTVSDPIATTRSARRVGHAFDVLLGHQSTTSVGLARAFPRLPLVHVFHASAALEGRFLRDRVHGPRRVAVAALEPVAVALERAALRRARTILVLSEFSGSLVTASHPTLAARVRKVSGAVDGRLLDGDAESPADLRRRLDVPDGDRLVLTTRRLEPRMGLEELLAALARVADLPITLVMTGDGSLLPLLRARAGELGVVDRVRFVGRVSERDLRALYRAADLFVLPTVAYEGFGMSTVEALACGTPVLGTAVGATPEILAPIDPGLLVEHADAEAIAAGMRCLLPRLTPGLRERCASHARSRYTWDRAIVDWENAISAAAIDGIPDVGTL